MKSVEAGQWDGVSKGDDQDLFPELDEKDILEAEGFGPLQTAPATE